MLHSEDVDHCHLIIPTESSYAVASLLGELGKVSFINLNSDISFFQRKYSILVGQCEDIERGLLYLEHECSKENIKLADVLEYSQYPAPSHKELGDIQQIIRKSEEDLNNVSSNLISLKKNEMELLEIKELLSKAVIFLNETKQHDSYLNVTDDTPLLPEESSSGYSLNIIGGGINRKRMEAFERMIWRVSRGNVLMKHADISEETSSRYSEPRSIFLLLCQGEEIKSRIEKIIDGFHASKYPCPNTNEECQYILTDVNMRLNDLQRVLSQGQEHRTELLRNSANHLRVWMIQVRKSKAIYHVLNSCNIDLIQKVLIAECWIPKSDFDSVHSAITSINSLSSSSSSSVPIILSVMHSCTHQLRPTVLRTNKYTAGFQALIDAYGVNSTGEVNPAYFSIITFPFFFSLMFGDVGHGLILTLIALSLIINERKLEKVHDEIFSMFFGGRYIVLLLGLFSMYAGLIYNDCFSKSFNIFGSQWKFSGNLSFPLSTHLDSMSLDPGNKEESWQGSYFLGIDPIWKLASNSISFLNTFKMKISLIFGLLHMAFGLSLSAVNSIHFKRKINLLLEIFPQFIFLLFIFFYLLFLIFLKWTSYSADNSKKSNPWSEHCAPNLLITFINMMLFKSVDENSDPELAALCHGTQFYMYAHQETLQKCLLLIALSMIPLLLFGKPCLYIFKKIRGRTTTTTSENSGSQDEEESFGDMMIYQTIHTIEYILGTVSHTASYLRLWALSLAHSQLSEVLWTMVLRNGFSRSLFFGGPAMFVTFFLWSLLTVSILVVMEGLSAFLHTLRLHWVEFMSKFYSGQGEIFTPYSFESILKNREIADSSKV